MIKISNVKYNVNEAGIVLIFDMREIFNPLFFVYVESKLRTKWQTEKKGVHKIKS